MTPRDIARLEFELHSDLLTRALGSGGAPVDLPQARIEMQAAELALHTLIAVIVGEMREAAAP